jgi:hypothetical protein
MVDTSMANTSTQFRSRQEILVSTYSGCVPARAAASQHRELVFVESDAAEIDGIVNPVAAWSAKPGIQTLLEVEEVRREPRLEIYCSAMHTP